MKDKYFIDTNILVYANDRSENGKYKKARQIILNGIASENIALSTQVLSEFFVAVTKKIQVKMKVQHALKEIVLLNSIEIVDIDYNLVLQGIHISEKYSLSFWDSLIVAAADKARCNIIYSEDLNPNQIIGSVIVHNPF